MKDKDKKYIKPSEFLDSMASKGFNYINNTVTYSLDKRLTKRLDQEFIHKSVLEDYKKELKERINNIKIRRFYINKNGQTNYKTKSEYELKKEILKLLEDKGEK